MINLNLKPSATWVKAVKVPAKITIYFWIIKLLTTAMGEAASDYSVHRFNPYLAVAMGAVILVACLILQLSVKRYIAGVYWLAAVGVSISGTMGADVLHVGFGIPYIVSALFYAVALAVIFIWWSKVSGRCPFIVSIAAGGTVLLGGGAGHFCHGYGYRRSDCLHPQTGFFDFGNLVCYRFYPAGYCLLVV